MLALRAEAARRLGCEVTSLDPETGYLAEICRDGARHLLLGGFSPLNSALAARIAEDKFHTALLLRRAGFRVAQAVRCLRPGRFLQEDFSAHTGMEPALEFAEENGFPLVIKPNRGARGRHVEVVRSTEELISGIRQIWEYDYLALAQPVVDGLDVRLDYLDGKFLLGYIRRPVVLQGDGVSTAAELLAQTDPRFSGDLFRKTLEDDPIWTERAAPRDLNLDSVLPAGEPLDLRSPIMNLNRLCVAEIVLDPEPGWAEHGRDIGAALGLRHFGIDYKTTDPQADPREATVLEVNASPSLVQMSRLGYYEETLQAEIRIVEAVLASADRS